jgi:hypothetical protein
MMSASQLGETMPNPAPYTVKEAMFAVPAGGLWNLEQTKQQAISLVDDLLQGFGTEQV